MSKTRKGNIPHPATPVTILALILLLNFFIILPAPKILASPEACKWTGVSIPAGGAGGGWVLADGSNVKHLTSAAGGTLYADAEGLTHTLYKSTDGGLKWSYINQVQDNIVGIAASPHDPDTIYYATTASVFRSTNGGKTFIQMPPNPGGAGTGNIEITSIAAAWLNNNVIAVGTRDADNAEFGGVYTLDEAIPNWLDTEIGNYDVYAVAFSPGYATDRQIVAVATDETDTFVANRIGNADWNAFVGSARLNRDNAVVPAAVAVTDAAAIAFPRDYNAYSNSSRRFFFVGIDTGSGEGDVYKINCVDAPGNTTATDLNIDSIYGGSNTDITGLAVYSDEQSVVLLAGAADSSRTYVSADGGTSWTRSSKEPTGDADTFVLISRDFATTGVMYAATSGDGSAFSISRDFGISWNQISLIDTTIDVIVDVAPSPNYSQDNTMFMITFGGENSLWRSTNDGFTWERILSGNHAGVGSLSLVALPPRYGSDCQAVFIAGESSGNPAIWKSEDNGQNYICRITHDPATGMAFPIDAWSIVDENTLYIAGYDGIQAKVYLTFNSGFFYVAGVPAGDHPFDAIALSPDYENDGVILGGNTGGWVYYSSDNGSSFQSLPPDAALSPFTGSVDIAFDPEFNTNHIVYASDDAADSGIYRFIIGQSTGWESIDDTLPAGARINRLAVSDDGVLYAANSDIDGGMERCLNPKLTSGPAFETVTSGLSSGAILDGLWQGNGRLWTIDTANGRLLTYLDTLASPVIQVSPENEISGIGSLIDHTVRNITIDWETKDGATSYEWQCDDDTDFSSIPDGLEGTISASYVRLPALEPATTYYWRIRVSVPVLSPWSPKWSFTTSLDAEGVALKPEFPMAGAAGVSIRPVFQWTAVAGAEAYELLVAGNADFENPAVVRIGDYALPTNAWQCDVSLDYDTTYYWKVRATTASTHSVWSSAGVFTTESAPKEENELPDELPTLNTEAIKDGIVALNPSKSISPMSGTTPAEQVLPPSSSSTQLPIQVPAASQLQGIPDWIIYLIGGLLAIVLLALIIVLAIVLKMRRF